MGSRDGAVVRTLTSHRCGLGSIPSVDIICGLSLLLVLVPAPRVFLRELRFSSLHENKPSQIPIQPGNTVDERDSQWKPLKFPFILLLSYFTFLSK